MKKLFVTLALVALIVASPICVRAAIIGNVNLKVTATSPTGYVTFPDPTGYGNYYLDYDVTLNGGPLVEAFCVENRPASSSTQPYTLLSIDSSLGAGFEKYVMAAAIADYFYATNPSSESLKAAAQIAIWETMFDSSFLLGAGDFQASNGYSDAAWTIWDTARTSPAFSASSNSNWALAVNPTITASTGQHSTDFQNYLVRTSVPEPTALLLLGLSFLGLAPLRRFLKK